MLAAYEHTRGTNGASHAHRTARPARLDGGGASIDDRNPHRLSDTEGADVSVAHGPAPSGGAARSILRRVVGIAGSDAIAITRRRALYHRISSIAIAAAGLSLAAGAAWAGGGDPITADATSAANIATGVGVPALIAGCGGVGAGAIMRSGGMMATGGAALLGGAVWTGGPQLIPLIFQTSAGFTLLSPLFS